MLSRQLLGSSWLAAAAITLQCIVGKANHLLFLLLQVRHKNVVQFIGACTRKPNLCIVFEYMSGGSVYDWIRREGPLKLSQVRSLSELCGLC